MVRSLTDAEAQVIGALLASARVSERARLQRAGVPRSTYHAARRRAYEEGWLRDRYIPDPVEYGLPFAAAVLARPYADRQAPLVADRLGDGGTVYLAHSGALTLAIGWYATEEEARAAAGRPSTGGFASWSFPLVADLARPTVPVYFDFEGSFAHLGEAAGPEGYPEGLGGDPADPRHAEVPAPERRSSWAVTSLVHRPFPSDGADRAPHLVGPLGLPWGQQKLLNQGWVRHRVLLDPARLPPFRGRSGEMLVFVAGTFRDGARPSELFEALTRSCRVFPFLFVAAEDRLLLGALGQPPGTAPSVPATDRRPSVLGTLRERVEGIEILQEPAASFVTDLDHRYDRLFPRSD